MPMNSEPIPSGKVRTALRSITREYGAMMRIWRERKLEPPPEYSFHRMQVLRRQWELNEDKFLSRMNTLFDKLRLAREAEDKVEAVEQHRLETGDPGTERVLELIHTLQEQSRLSKCKD